MFASHVPHSIRQGRRGSLRRLSLRVLAGWLLLTSLGWPAGMSTTLAQSVSTDFAMALSLVSRYRKDLKVDPNTPLPVDANTFEQARATLFKHNGLLQDLALNGYISDDTYQAAQSDYADLNESFASDAADRVGAKFSKQVSKTPSCYSPGTDSDYLVVADSVDHVRGMQAIYNDSVNRYLDANGVLSPEEAGQNIEWHRRLDTDFMPTNTNDLTDAAFREMNSYNNAAYSRRGAADVEKLLRQPIESTFLTPEAFDDAYITGTKTPTGLIAKHVEQVSQQGALTPGGVSDYAQEMNEMQQHRVDFQNKIKSDPNFLDDPSSRAQWFKHAALEQKYISRVEVLTDALRLQNGLNAIDRGSQPSDQGKSLALRGSSRAAENFAVTGEANRVASSSLDRATMELSSTIAEISKSNPDFAPPNGPSLIAQMAKDLSPEDRGFLLEQIRTGAGSDQFAAQVASTMNGDNRPVSNNAAYKAKFQEGVDQGKQQAAKDIANNGGGDSTFAEWDQAMADSIGIDNDLSKISNVNRVQLNQFGQKWLPRMNTALGAYFAGKELYGAGQDMGQYLDLMSAAMDSNTPDAVAQQYLASAQQIAQGMAIKGTWGAAMATVLEAFPTAGAIIGTFAISYNGTRWVLETTGADKLVTIDLAVSGIDLGNQTVEGASNAIDKFWNGSTRAERETNMLLAAYQRALDRGDIILRDGVTQQDLIDAVRAGDLGRIHNQLVHNNYCGLPNSKVNLVSKAPAASTKSAGTICNWGGSWKGSESYPSTLTMKLIQSVKTNSAGVVVGIAVAPTSDTNNPDAPTGTLTVDSISNLNGTWSTSSTTRGGAVEYVMDAGCNKFRGQRYDCYKGTPLPSWDLRDTRPCSSGSFAPMKIIYERTGGQPMVPVPINPTG